MTTARIICRAGGPCCSRSGLASGTGAFEVQAGGVHEHQIQPREQIAPMREQPFLDQILNAAGRKRRAAVLILRRQPSHAMAR
jgi:hypothetical protein